MKHAFFILSLLITTVGSSQSYKVITCSEGVTVDDVPVKPGMIIEHSSVALHVPKGGYVGILTDDGFLGSVSRPLPVDHIKSGMTMHPVYKEGRGVHGGTPFRYPLGPADWDQNPNRSNLIGDSIFVAWYLKFGPPTQVNTLHVNDIFGRSIFSTPLTKQWAVLNITQIRQKEESVILELKEGERNSTSCWFVQPTSKGKEKVLKELAVFASDPDRLFYESAVYQLNDLYYDQSMPIYKILTQKLSATDSFLRSYFEKLREVRHLDKIELD